MLKNLSSLVHTIGDKTYHFICDHDAPLDHVENALFHFLTYVRQIQESVRAKQAEAKESKALEESPEQKKE